MSQAVMVQNVRGSDVMLEAGFGIEVPMGGFDADGWSMAVDSVYFSLSNRPFLIQELLKHAPEGADEELIALLKEMEQPWIERAQDATIAAVN